jgi:hypothetical protein
MPLLTGNLRRKPVNTSRNIVGYSIIPVENSGRDCGGLVISVVKWIETSITARRLPNT